MLTGANATSPRTTLVLRAMPDDDQAAIIRTLTLPGTAVPTRMKLVVGSQGGYWGGVYAPNTTAAVKLAPCGAGCLFNLDLDQTEHVDLSKDPRYASTLKTLQDELEAARATYYQSPGTKAGDKTAVPWAKAHGGFWGPWLPGEPPRYRCHLGCILLKTAAISLRTGSQKRSLCSRTVRSSGRCVRRTTRPPALHTRISRSYPVAKLGRAAAPGVLPCDCRPREEGRGAGSTTIRQPCPQRYRRGSVTTHGARS